MSEKLVNDIRRNLGQKVRDLHVHSPRRVYLEVAPEDLVAVAGVLFSDMGARYAIASGMQTADGFEVASGMQTADGFEVLHHFAFDAEHCVVSVRVRTDSQEPEFDSLAPLIKGAAFIEREMRDLLGIAFRGHPNPERLILSDDWPEGVYPLRRGKPWEGRVRKQI